MWDRRLKWVLLRMHRTIAKSKRENANSESALNQKLTFEAFLLNWMQLFFGSLTSKFPSPMKAKVAKIEHIKMMIFLPLQSAYLFTKSDKKLVLSELHLNSTTGLCLPQMN